MALNHDPVETTVLYMERCVEIEQDWEYDTSESA